MKHMVTLNYLLQGLPPSEQLLEKSLVEVLQNTLTTNQRVAFDTIKWYHYGARGVGRTYLSAIVAICYALEHPNYPVKLVDHTRDPYMSSFLMDEVREIIGHFPEIIQKRFRIILPDKSIRYDLEEGA